MTYSVEIPIIVDKLSIDGIKSTKHDFIKKQLQSERIFAAKTMEEVVKEIKEVKERLADLDIFDNINVVLDKTDSPKTPYDQCAKLHVIFNVDEKKPRKFDVKAMCGLDNSVGLNIELISRNLFGRAGKLDINYHNSVSSEGGRSFAFIKPLEGMPRIKVAFGGWDNSFDHSWSRFLESSSGGYSELMMKTKLGYHRCKFETMWREIIANDKAPIEVRKESGHAMKCSLKHTFTRDTRDDSVFPSSGYRVSLVQEIFTDLNRVGGDPSAPISNLTLKLEAELQKSLSFRQFVFENTLCCGLLRSMTSEETKVPIADRFFVGGPLTMRGFALRSMGPLATGEAVPVGGLAYLQHGAHLYSPLPFLGAEGYAGLFRLHGFLTSAAVSASPWTVSRGNSVSAAAGDVGSEGRSLIGGCLASMRCTAGLGVALRLASVFRLEVNYCLPVIGCGGVPGFQFGIGVQYA